MKFRLLLIFIVAFILSACAVDDDITASNNEDVVINVLDNDQFRNPVLTTLVDNGNLVGVTLTSEGILTLPAGNQAGQYTITYKACGKRRTKRHLCDTAIVNVTLNGTIVPIIAENDTLLANSSNTIFNVLANDTFDGEPLLPELVTATLVDDGGLPSVLLTDAGDLTVPQDSEAGEYALSYMICEKSNPSNCDTANISLVVEAELPEFFKTNDKLLLETNLSSGFVSSTYELSTRTVSTALLSNVVWTTEDGQEKTGNNVEFQFSEAGLQLVSVSAVTSEGVELSEGITLSIFDDNGSLPGANLPSLRGDINLDGIVSEEDVTLAQQIASSEALTIDGEGFLNGDLDLDGVITDIDAELINDMVMNGQSLPNVINPIIASPLSVVQIISPELEQIENSFQVQVGDSAQRFDLNILMPGYSNFIVPYDFAGAGTSGELGGDFVVTLYSNGIAVEDFNLEILSEAIPTAEPRDLLSAYLSDVETFLGLYEQDFTILMNTGGAELNDVNVFLAPFRETLEELAEVTIEINNALEMGTDDEVEFLYQAIEANGLSKFNALYAEFTNPSVQTSGNQKASPFIRSQSKTNTSLCMDTIPNLCRIKRAAPILNAAATVSEGICDVATAFFIVTVVAKQDGKFGERVALGSVARSCGKYESLVGTANFLTQYFSNFDFDFELGASDVSFDNDITGEFVIKGQVKLSGITNFCNLAVQSNSTQKIADELVEYIYQRRVKSRAITRTIESVGGRLGEDLAERLSELIRKQIANTITQIEIDVALKRVVESVCSNFELGSFNEISTNFVILSSSNPAGIFVSSPSIDAPVTYICNTPSSVGEIVEITGKKPGCGADLKESRIELFCPPVPI